MSLINFGTGEISDRLTVLSLKLLHYGAAGKPTAHLRTEQAALLARIRTQTVNGSWLEQLLELGAVNAALWGLTDELRDVADASTPETLQTAGMLGLRIMALNDRRAELVEAINKLTGEHRGSEKGRGEGVADAP
jgi:hypothetical protein